jgi:siderophore synthetase component
MGVKPMIHSKNIAENATMQSFLNCYLRETGSYYDSSIDQHDQFAELTDLEKVMICPLPNQQINLIIPVKYWSLTGRHLFHFPLYYQTGEKGEVRPIDYVTLTSLHLTQLLLGQKRNDSEDELVLRVILSCQSMKTYIEERLNEADSLMAEDFEYIDAEQSLLFGHLLHPTPKSKQGLSEEEDRSYSPERKGTFQLHYFSADRSIVLQDSAKSLSAAELIIEELQNDPKVDKQWLEPFKRSKERILIPAHPLQAKKLLNTPKVRNLLNKGILDYIGPVGRAFTATSSFRTVYSQKSKYMFKFSVPVKITNSLRSNQQKELDTFGIALEAHQQNSIIELKNGYPVDFYYRDNQGYYFSQSKADQLVELLPSLNSKSDTICTDEIAEERLRYYFFYNHLFGLINGFGVSGLIDEERLIHVLRSRLEMHHKSTGNLSRLLNSLLHDPVLPCKANLLTRFQDMDELVGSLESQSVYTMVTNPIVKGGLVPNAT